MINYNLLVDVATRKAIEQSSLLYPVGDKRREQIQHKLMIEYLMQHISENPYRAHWS